MMQLARRQVRPLRDPAHCLSALGERSCDDGRDVCLRSKTALGERFQDTGKGAAAGTALHRLGVDVPVSGWYTTKRVSDRERRDAAPGQVPVVRLAEKPSTTPSPSLVLKIHLFRLALRLCRPSVRPGFEILLPCHRTASSAAALMARPRCPLRA